MPKWDCHSIIEREYWRKNILRCGVRRDDCEWVIKISKNVSIFTILWVVCGYNLFLLVEQGRLFTQWRISSYYEIPYRKIYAVEWAIILSQHARANFYKHRTKRSYKNYEILINRRVGRECLIYAMYHCIFDKDYRSYVFSSLKVIISNNRKEKKIVRAVSHKRSLEHFFPKINRSFCEARYLEMKRLKARRKIRR